MSFRPIKPILARRLSGDAQSGRVYAGPRVGTIVPNAPITGTIQKLGAGRLHDTPAETAQSAGAGAPAKGLPIKLESTTYECLIDSGATPLNADSIAYANGSGGVAGQDLVLLSRGKAVDDLLRKDEGRLNTFMGTTANWNSTQSATLLGADQWTDPASKPFNQIMDRIASIKGERYGICLGQWSLIAFMQNENNKSALNFSVDSQVMTAAKSLELLRTLLSVQSGGQIAKVNVSRAQNDDGSYIVDDLCFVYALDSAMAGPRGVTVDNSAFIRAWNGISPMELGAGGDAGKVQIAGEYGFKEYYSNEERSWMFEAHHRQARVKLQSDNAFVLKDCHGTK